MGRAIGMVEYKTVSKGMLAADAMLKAAEVDIIEAQTVCPGKYIILLSGELSAINASVDTARARYAADLIDSFILGNPHEAIFPAIYGTTRIEKMKALGILETFSAASIIVAADEAAKTSEVDLIELRIAKGMCGKSYMLLTGEVAAVEAAISKAKAAVGEKAMLLDYSIIANPDDKLCKSIL
jgi:Carbon dioxide concentrating mechanism/carboxysome shell protein